MVVHWAVQIFDVEATVLLTTAPAILRIGSMASTPGISAPKRERERKQIDRWTDRYR
jgi:hypothetical protein